MRFTNIPEMACNFYRHSGGDDARVRCCRRRARRAHRGIEATWDDVMLTPRVYSAFTRPSNYIHAKSDDTACLFSQSEREALLSHPLAWRAIPEIMDCACCEIVACMRPQRGSLRACVLGNTGT